MDEQWYNLSHDEALKELDSRRSGLTVNEARSRLLQYGPNQLQGKKKTPPALVFLRQFLSPLIYVLLVAALISNVWGGRGGASDCGGDGGGWW